MSNDIFYIANDNYEKGSSIVELGSQYILVQHVNDEFLMLRPVDSKEGSEEIIVPKRIMELMSSPSGEKSAESTHLNRSMSAMNSHNKYTGSISDDNSDVTSNKYSTFGHGAIAREQMKMRAVDKSNTSPPSISKSVYEESGGGGGGSGGGANEGTDSNYHSNQSTEDTGSNEDELDVDDVTAGAKEEVDEPVRRRDKSQLSSVAMSIDAAWELHKDGHSGDLYVNKDTGERWRATVDQEGRKYFYEESMRISLWNLPGQERPGEPSFGERAVAPLDEVLEGLDNEDEDRDENEDDDDDEFDEDEDEDNDKKESKTQSQLLESDQQNSEQKFRPHKIKKEHIIHQSNQFVRTEKTGMVEKIKVMQNSRPVSHQKYSKFYMVLTGPELFFYKDVKAAQPKKGQIHGKVDLRLKIENLTFSELLQDGSASKNKGGTTINPNPVLVVKDEGAPGSSITYHLKFSDQKILNGWIQALTLAKEWHNENRYDENSSKIILTPDKRLVEVQIDEEPMRDKQNIKLLLGRFIRARPDPMTLEAKGILRTPPVFGCTLEKLCVKNRIPEFVYRCILAIEARGLTTSGIYRISGNQAKIQKLRLAVDANTYKLNSDDIDFETLTGALKLFFKELQQPLLDEEFCTKMNDILSVKSTSKKNPYKDVNMAAAKKCASKMKKSHFETAKSLFKHLQKVASYSSKNLMDVGNISMVWGPNLYHTSGQASTKLAVILMTRNQIIDFLITRCDEIFLDPKT